MGKTSDFGQRLCRNGCTTHQTQHDPIVPPTDKRLGAAGDERIVMHAGAIKGESAFAAQGVIDGPQVLILNPLAVAASWHAGGKLPDGWWTSFDAGDIGASIPKPLKLPKDLKRM